MTQTDLAKSDTSSSVREAVKMDKSFVHFNLNLDAADTGALDSLKVSHQDSYDNFGAADRLKPEAGRFLESLGNSPAAAARGAGIIDRLVAETLAAFNAEAAWVTIRSFLPGEAYDIPRWHQDGSFFDSPDEQRKVAMVLKGAPTLFNDIPDHLRDAFNKVARSSRPNDDEMARRKEIVALLDASLTQTAGPGQGSVFVVGSDRAAVHSEPALHTERLFVSVLPGTKAQIEQLSERWNKPATTYANAKSAAPATAAEAKREDLPSAKSPNSPNKLTP